MSVDLETVRDVIHSVLDTRTGDSIPLDGSDGRTAHVVDNESHVVVSQAHDPRRNEEPRNFSERSRWCFCDKTRSKKWYGIDPTQPSNLYLDFTDFSGVCLMRSGGKANQFATNCGPEPTPQHVVDMMTIASILDERALTVTNLPGSGASVPQHFHTQIHSLRYRAMNGAWERDSLARQLDCIHVTGNPWPVMDKQHGKSVILDIIDRPVWGISLDFSQYSDPSVVGRLLFAAVHHAVRYRSRLEYGYNCYIQSGVASQATSPDWRRVKVLFRESRLERPCVTNEMCELVRGKSTSEQAVKIQQSDNRFWRWGFWEMIGGLFARDASFDDESAFDAKFWESVYQFLSVPEGYRNQIIERIQAAITGFGDEFR